VGCAGLLGVKTEVHVSAREGQVPPPAVRGGAIQGAVYSSVARELAQVTGEVWPLHVGDTWLRPPPGCAVEELADIAPPGMNKYTAVAGWAPLLEAARARIAQRTGVDVGPEGVFATAGATAGLAAVVLAMVDPGSQVLILSPAWPLLANMVRLAGGVATHVPAIDRDAEQVAAALESAAGPTAVAVYLNTPNNPSGRLIPRSVLDAVVAFARRRGLWILSDEVYEDYVYAGEHTWTMSLAPERTLGVWSFSKGFGMAGYRCGLIAGPAALVREAVKTSTYTYYCAPFPAQVAALRALGPAGDAWVAETRAQYQRIGDAVADRLGVARPEGGTFLFLDLAAHLDDDGLEGFLRGCARDGLLLAPGPVFGDYPTHVRLCFTAIAPEATMRGVEVLARRLGR
jgi:aspartate/methionine/tyrosine aminotransferase